MTTDRGRRATYAAALIAAVLVSTHLLHGMLPGLFQPLAARFTDRLFVLRSGIEGLRPQYDGTVVHVDIDDRSLRERGDFYLDRTDHARLVRNLHRTGIVAQAHDIIFAAPAPPEQDRELIAATAEAEGVFFGMAAGLSAGGELAPIDGSDPIDDGLAERVVWRMPGVAAEGLPVVSRFLPTFPALAEASRGLGFLDIVPDRDGTYRRVPLLAHAGSDRFVPSLALRVICDYLSVTPERIDVRPGRAITLRDAMRPGATKAEDIVIPVDAQVRMILNFTGAWGSLTHYPFFVVYDASDDRFMLEDLREELEGRIAVVSWIATGAGDLGPVPTDPLFPLSGVHAQTMNTVLSGEFLREVGPIKLLLFAEIPLLLILLLAALRLRTVWFGLSAAALLIVYNLAAILCFLYAGLILDVPRPAMAVILSTGLVALFQYHHEAKRRAVMRSTLDTFFSPSVVEKMMRHAGDLTATAQKKELTILFSDIRGFTTHTSRMEPTHVRKLLNEYFDRMIEIVFRHEGTLDKFIGDGLMVFFGDPEDQPDHARRCVAAAIEMQAAVAVLARTWEARGDMPLAVRIGINTGEVIVGNMGSARRLSYTALGEAVNVAQRLESVAPPGKILISARTHALLDGSIPCSGPESVQVKGIAEPITVFGVTS